MNYGDSQTFTISADTDTGYHISDVLIDGLSVGQVTEYRFNNVTANHTIEATFEAASIIIDNTDSEFSEVGVWNISGYPNPFGKDPNTNRENEIIGYIVIEAGLGIIDGVKYEAFLEKDSIRGVNNSTPYRYNLSNFSSTPEVAIATQAAMDGNNGGWAYLYGLTPLTDASIDLLVDEDQLRDSERNHTTEQIGCIVFESSFAYSD